MVVLPVVLSDESVDGSKGRAHVGLCGSFLELGFSDSPPLPLGKIVPIPLTLLHRSLVSMALIISVAPAWTPSSLSKPFQEE